MSLIVWKIDCHCIGWWVGPHVLVACCRVMMSKAGQATMPMVCSGQAVGFATEVEEQKGANPSGGVGPTWEHVEVWEWMGLWVGPWVLL